eukprot:Nk52_evm47s359 gene=Nk52_evmTU47s359
MKDDIVDGISKTPSDSNDLNTDQEIAEEININGGHEFLNVDTNLSDSEQEEEEERGGDASQYVALAQNAEDPMSNDLCEAAEWEGRNSSNDSVSNSSSRTPEFGTMGEVGQGLFNSGGISENINRSPGPAQESEEDTIDEREKREEEEEEEEEPKSVHVDPISDEDLNIIQSAMSNIVIPEACIPQWAANIPEDEWLSRLTNRISFRN